MAAESLLSHRRDPIKASPVAHVAGHRRRQNAVTIGKERRVALVRSKRLCRVGISDISLDGDTTISDEEDSVLDAQTVSAMEELKASIALQGKGALQKRVYALQKLRRLLSKPDFPPVEAALRSGAIPALVHCLSFSSPDEQLLEAAWCLTNIAAGKPEETRALLPALPYLVAHLGEKSSSHVAEQCAWALGNVAGEGEEFRAILLSQGSLRSLVRMLLCNRGSAVRTAAWALSNLIKGPDPKAATELTKMEGAVTAVVHHLRKGDDELATEIAWLLVYLSALSDATLCLLKNAAPLEALVDRLASVDNLQLLIPVLRSIGNLVAGDSAAAGDVLAAGRELTKTALCGIIKCLKSEHRVLKKEAAWVLSNVATMTEGHKRLVYSSEALHLLVHLLVTSTFDVRKEAAYVLGNLCIMPDESDTGREPSFIVEHLVFLVRSGCIRGFLALIRSADLEAARLGLQFIELVLRAMPNGEGPKLVDMEDGIDAIELFQFHENEGLRSMANGLVNTYFGDHYDLHD